MPAQLIESRQLLAGKKVLITPAAGTGIGPAAAKRCIEEGARVVISDAHERRLAQTAWQLSGRAWRCIRCCRK